MTIKILKKVVNIELCHELFRTRVYYDTYEKHHVRLQSSTEQSSAMASEDVAWTKRDGFWMYMPDPWHENYFGLSEQKPSAWEAQTVACTFDFHPDRSGAGAFGRDGYGGILVLHSGDIPVHSADAKAVFWQHYQGPRIDSTDQNPAYAVVAHLGALDVTGQLRSFLDEVVRIQHAAG
ncbi:MAG: hypothetical protein V2J55_10260 [Candidatus Competibacteraceae bacterium]|jgi:hypothetical protein|nr:hypothetical protein [Candidatus Competibacteraceae bacterium]